MVLKRDGIIFMNVRKAWVLEMSYKTRTGEVKSFREYHFNRSGGETRMRQFHNKFQVIKASLAEEFVHRSANN